MMFLYRNSVFGSQHFTPFFQSSLNAICLSRPHHSILGCQSVFPSSHWYVHVTSYLHSDGTVLVEFFQTPLMFSAEAICHHHVFRPVHRYTLRIGVHSGDISLRIGANYYCLSSSISCRKISLLFGPVSYSCCSSIRASYSNCRKPSPH